MYCVRVGTFRITNRYLHSAAGCMNTAQIGFEHYRSDRCQGRATEPITIMAIRMHFCDSPSCSARTRPTPYTRPCELVQYCTVARKYCRCAAHPAYFTCIPMYPNRPYLDRYLVLASPSAQVHTHFRSSVVLPRYAISLAVHQISIAWRLRSRPNQPCFPP